MTIAWKSEYAIGHSTIDSQHQELFARFNQLMVACRQKQGRQEIGRLFEFLGTYVEEHFNAEQALMKAHGYPEIEMHLRQHREFREKLQDWRSRLEEGGASLDLLVETNEALMNWLLRHIRTVDRALGSFLNHEQA